MQEENFGINIEKVSEKRQTRATETSQEELKGRFSFSFDKFFTLARRKPLPIKLDTIPNLQAALRSNPYAFMRVLPSVNPIVGQALWNVLRFSVPVSDEIKIIIRKDGVVLEEETKEINAFFENLPQEIGGLVGLINTLLHDAWLSDKKMIECVPGPELTGLKEIWPLCPDSFILARKTHNGPVVVFQKQAYKKNSRAGWETTYVEFGQNRILWSANDSDSSNVDGKLPFNAAMIEGIRDMETARDLSDSIRNAAYPSRVFGVNFQELYRIAVEVFKKKSVVEAGQFVKDQFELMVDYSKKVKPSDNLVTDSSGSITNLPAADFRGVEPGLEYLRQRLVSSVNSLPTLHGLGNDTTKNSIEYQLYTTAIRSKQDEVFALIRKACRLHFRMQGKIVEADILSPRIRTNDELIEENTREVKLRVGVAELALGLINHEELGYRMNQRKPVGEIMDGAVESLLKIQPDANGSKKTGKDNNANQGGTQGKA